MTAWVRMDDNGVDSLGMGEEVARHMQKEPRMWIVRVMARGILEYSVGAHLEGPSVLCGAYVNLGGMDERWNR